MGLELSEKEKDVLKQALSSYEKELRDEIGKTDDRELKNVLQGEEDIIKGLIAKLS